MQSNTPHNISYHLFILFTCLLMMFHGCSGPEGPQGELQFVTGNQDASVEHLTDEHSTSPEQKSPQETIVPDKTAPSPESSSPPEQVAPEPSQPEPRVESTPKEAPSYPPDKGNTPPVMSLPSGLSLDEEKDFTYTVNVRDDDGDTVRVFVLGLPPGAYWDQAKKQLHFRPTFIQGGKSWTLTFLAFDGRHKVSKQLTLTVKDTIAPPWPTIRSRLKKTSYTSLLMQQKTDSFLDSPGYAGRTFLGRIAVPNKLSSKKLPVLVYLHSLGGSASSYGTSTGFRIYPHDPHTTYWWGYSDQLPNKTPTQGQSLNYTQRRVMHLLAWLFKNYPQADPERVYVSGSSMGGGGAKFLGLRYARHFCYLSAVLGIANMANRNPKSYRMTRLQKHWGPRNANLKDDRGWTPWDYADSTRMLRDHREAQNQYIFTRHGKDDATIHFNAVHSKSQTTQLSFYQALQTYRIGHYAVWDEGAHGPADPVLGKNWWSSGWSFLSSKTAFLRRNLLFPAFTRCSADQDAGTGKGNGKRKWSNTSGYAGKSSVAGDTGWDGDIAGAYNRFLRWDSSKIVDTIEKISIPLHVVDGTGKKAPRSGYPSTGNYVDKPLPIKADVTLRRIQQFQVQPGDILIWTFGKQQGEITVDSSGRITVPQLSFTKSWSTLQIRRKNPLQP